MNDGTTEDCNPFPLTASAQSESVERLMFLVLQSCFVLFWKWFALASDHTSILLSQNYSLDTRMNFIILSINLLIAFNSSPLLKCNSQRDRLDWRKLLSLPVEMGWWSII